MKNFINTFKKETWKGLVLIMMIIGLFSVVFWGKVLLSNEYNNMSLIEAHKAEVTHMAEVHNDMVDEWVDLLVVEK